MLLTVIDIKQDIQIRICDQLELLTVTPKGLQAEMFKIGSLLKIHRLLIDGAPFPRPGGKVTEFDRRLATEIKTSIERNAKTYLPLLDADAGAATHDGSPYGSEGVKRLHLSVV